MSDELLLRELRAYVRKWGRRDPARALASWVGTDGLILGEWHSGVESSLALVEALAAGGRFRYWATEWFFPATLSEIARVVFRFAPVALSVDGRVIQRRWKPILDSARRLSKRAFPILRAGTASESKRDALIADNFRAEAEAQSIAVGTPGILQLGAGHASAVPFYDSTSTTAQLLASSGWRFAGACIVTTRVAGGGQRDPSSSSIRVIKGDGTDHPLFSLMGARTTVLAVPLRRRWRTARKGPFYYVRLAQSTSDRALAEQFEYLVLIRD